MSTDGQRPRLNIDPFFDGESELGGQPGLPGYQQPGVPPGVTVGAQGGAYQDVGSQILMDGRPASVVMRPSQAGLRGTVIPHASPGGIPIGTRPHETESVQLTVDPHLPQQRFNVNLSDINNAALADAEQMAREATPEPWDIATARLRGSATMQGLSLLAGTPAPTSRPAALPPQALEVPGNIPAPHLQQHATVAPRQVSPLAAFDQRSAPPAPNGFGNREPRRVDLSQSPSPGRPPGVRVTFEFSGMGTQHGRYHDVLFQAGCIVLVFDTSYGEDYYQPPVAEEGSDAPPMALHVEGSQEVCLVHSTGIHFPYNGIVFIILMIERTAPLPTVEEGALP